MNVRMGVWWWWWDRSGGLHTIGQIPYKWSLHCSGSHKSLLGHESPRLASLNHICFGTPYNATPDKKCVEIWAKAAFL